MPKTKISEFSSTPANNTDIDSINIAEGCAPSGINDAIRELMAQLKDFQTGAVGDSFNGPVGTTTPAAGAFTTLSATGNVTLGDASTDTLNVGNGGLIKDASGNLGLGVTPSAWWSGVKASQVQGASLLSSGSTMSLTANAFLNSTPEWRYINTANATHYEQTLGQHRWFNAPSGTAGTAISFTQAMTLDANGYLVIGDTSTYARLKVNCTGASTSSITTVSSFGAGNVVSVGKIANNDSGVYLGTGEALTGVSGGVASGIGFLRESSGWNSALAFYTNGTTDGVTTNRITERARIDSSGNLLVGTTSSTGSKITVNNVGSGGVYVIQGSGGGYSFASNAVVLSGAYYHMQMLQSGTPVGSITSSGSTTQYNTSSDYRLKNITGALTGYKERLMSLQPKQGTWIVDGSEFRGFLAHEFAQPYSSSVIGEKDALDESGNPIYQGMQASSSEVMADLVALVQEQQAIIESLKARLDAANL